MEFLRRCRACDRRGCAFGCMPHSGRGRVLTTVSPNFRCLRIPANFVVGLLHVVQ